MAVVVPQGGIYTLPAGLIAGLPVVVNNGTWSVVKVTAPAACCVYILAKNTVLLLAFLC